MIHTVCSGLESTLTTPQLGVLFFSIQKRFPPGRNSMDDLGRLICTRTRNPDMKYARFWTRMLVLVLVLAPVLVLVLVLVARPLTRMPRSAYSRASVLVMWPAGREHAFEKLLVESVWRPSTSTSTEHG